MSAAPEVGYGRNWWRTLHTLDGVDTKRIAKAVDRFLDDPDHPSLNLHPIEGDRTGRLHTFRASRELRVLLVKEGPFYWLLEAGHHDAIYERAQRQRFVASEPTRFVGLLDRDDASIEQRPSSRSTSPDGPGVLDHWTDTELAEAGLDDELVFLLRRCGSEDDLLALPMSDDTFDLVVELLETTPEQRRTVTRSPADREELIRRAMLDGAVLQGVSPFLPPDEVVRLAAAPIEDWMVFLHPEQRELVQRRFEGPARVRGSAGTGKTVVALHRAAALARRYSGGDRPPGSGPPILFTTYIKSLPPVLASLYARLPGTRPEDVDFLNLDKLAFRVCDAAGDRPPIDPRAVGAAFAVAWKKLVVPGTPIHDAGLAKPYIKDEITTVIKGRGIAILDDYLAVERTGRRVPFGTSLRRHVWSLHEEWNRQMQARHTVDFPDVVLRARDHARQRPHSLYRSAIVDEAQDLTLVGLQLVRALVKGTAAIDPPDGLLIVGDGAQRIYPGGYTLRQAGLEVRGRTTVLRHNYRNTRQIIEAAMAVAGREMVDDLGETFARADAPADAQRGGVRPVLVMASSFEDEIAFVVEEVQRLVASGAIGPGDMAVATATNGQSDAVTEALGAAGIATQGLQRYDGTPSARVKVGTHFRIKGLEFKVVFLPGLGVDDFPPPSDLTTPSGERDERRELAVSRLFVAMTRARDGLFLLCTGEPSDVLGPGLDRFELLDGRG